MGSFRDIVRSRRGPKGRGDEFKLGFTIDARESNVSSFELWIAFSQEGSQPHVSAFRWDFGGTDFLEIGAGPTGRTVWRIPDHEASMDLPFQFFRIGEGMFVHGVQEPGLDVIVDYLKGLFPDRTGNAWFLSETLCPPPPNLVPSAPLRSKPARTYNPVGEMPSSEGAHVPMLMMRLDRTDRPHWNELQGDPRRIRPRVRHVLGREGQATRQPDERPVPVAGQGANRTTRQPHGCRLRSEPDPADPGRRDAPRHGAAGPSCCSSPRSTSTHADRPHSLACSSIPQKSSATNS